MKKIIIILSIITISFSCKSQDNIISSSESTINGINFLGNDVALVVQHFGQPNTIDDYYFEMQDVMTQRYTYSDILFTIMENKVYSFEITGSNYVFTNHNIKVGNNISIFEFIYPLSFANKSSDALSLDFNDMDMYLIISFNSTNNVIDKIAIYSY